MTASEKIKQVEQTVAEIVKIINKEAKRYDLDKKFDSFVERMRKGK